MLNEKRKKALLALYIERHHGKEPTTDLEVTLFNFLVDLGGIYDGVVDEIRHLTKVGLDPDGSNVRTKIADLSRREADLNMLGNRIRRLLCIECRDQGTQYNIGTRGYVKNDQ